MFKLSKHYQPKDCDAFFEGPMLSCVQEQPHFIGIVILMQTLNLLLLLFGSAAFAEWIGL
jgi:hypothetical protein